jgi:hypothetical protein
VRSPLECLGNLNGVECPLRWSCKRWHHGIFRPDQPLMIPLQVGLYCTDYEQIEWMDCEQSEGGDRG